MQKGSKIVSRVHAESCPGNQKSKKKRQNKLILCIQSKRRARRAKSKACVRLESAYTPLIRYHPHSVGHPHTRTHSLLIKPLRSVGRLDTSTQGGRPEHSSAAISQCTSSAKALPKFLQPPVATRASKCESE